MCACVCVCVHAREPYVCGGVGEGWWWGEGGAHVFVCTHARACMCVYAMSVQSGLGVGMLEVGP